MIRTAMLVAVLALTPGPSDGVRAMELEKATFAGGCFWCVEATLEKVPGVKSVVSGYTGGHVENPSYQQVTTGRTGHIEAVEVTFDPTQISYEQVLQAFWMEFDPTDAGGSFYDRGQQYTSAIWYHSDEQRRIAEASRQQIIDSGVFREPIVTPILPAETFYPAEDYHQDYYKKNAGHYKRYRKGSGRDRFIQETWGDREARMARIEAAATDGPAGDELAHEAGNGRTYARPSDAELRKRLTPLQYKVTQRDGTEPAFRNEYWDNKQEGIYVDVASGEPLFSSVEKYESGTGWPSFWAPLVADNIVTKRDYKLILPRTEVRSKHGDSHLGHVFKDGPEPTGLRYCLNSAALRFIPKEDLEQEGYGEFLAHFE